MLVMGLVTVISLLSLLAFCASCACIWVLEGRREGFFCAEEMNAEALQVMKQKPEETHPLEQSATVQSCFS